MKLETENWVVETEKQSGEWQCLENLEVTCKSAPSAKVFIQGSDKGFSVFAMEKGKPPKLLATYKEKQTYRVGLFDENIVGVPKRTIKVLATTKSEAEKIATAKLNPKDSEFVNVMH